jgi:hypothetical protein
MEDNALLQGVSFAANLPLEWQPLKPASPATIHEWMHTNAVILRALAGMENLVEDKDYEAAGASGKILERVEAKLDLALSLLARLLASREGAPEEQPVVVSADGLEWRTATPPTLHQDILISLHLNSNLPQPLLLPAKVILVEGSVPANRVQARFQHLSDEAREWLERTVFRHHRRNISRRGQG